MLAYPVHVVESGCGIGPLPQAKGEAMKQVSEGRCVWCGERPRIEKEYPSELDTLVCGCDGEPVSVSQMKEAFERVRVAAKDLAEVAHRLYASLTRPACVDCRAPADELVLQQPRCAACANEVGRRVDFDAKEDAK